MADVVDAFTDRFNAGDAEGLAALLGPEYDYAEPVLGGVVDASGHLEAIRQYLELIPDRRFDVVGRRPTPGGVALECVYSGTRAADGERIELPMSVVFDIDDEAGVITRLRSYYDLPG